ncbi:hypothetical protein DPMN_034549 [Dreissena polymorpha]|uniref:Uncharacterized protein n=1 Tax=Dreissena polymorpha TaxID=45954 RepID=A0A9D4RM70_DREPO|nr:hypothetical protein DPMN_034549 [Dreissena polymorpha]
MQSFQVQQNIEYQRVAEQLSKTRYETEEIRQEIADCNIDLERAQNHYNHLQTLNHALLADIQQIQNIVKQQELALQSYQNRQQRLENDIEAFRALSEPYDCDQQCSSSRVHAPNETNSAHLYEQSYSFASPLYIASAIPTDETIVVSFDYADLLYVAKQFSQRSIKYLNIMLLSKRAMLSLYYYCNC